MQLLEGGREKVKNHWHYRWQLNKWNFGQISIKRANVASFWQAFQRENTSIFVFPIQIPSNVLTFNGEEDSGVFVAGDQALERDVSQSLDRFEVVQVQVHQGLARMNRKGDRVVLVFLDWLYFCTANVDFSTAALQACFQWWFACKAGLLFFFKDQLVMKRHTRLTAKIKKRIEIKLIMSWIGSSQWLRNINAPAMAKHV